MNWIIVVIVTLPVFVGVIGGEGRTLAPGLALGAASVAVGILAGETWGIVAWMAAWLICLALIASRTRLAKAGPS